MVAPVSSRQISETVTLGSAAMMVTGRKKNCALFGFFWREGPKGRQKPQQASVGRMRRCGSLASNAARSMWCPGVAMRSVTASGW